MLLASLLAITTFVFANSKKFLNSGLVVKDASGIYHQISQESALTTSDLQTTTTGNEMKLSNQAGALRSVFFYDGSTYTPVRSNGNW